MSLISSLVQRVKKTWLAGTQYWLGRGTTRSQSSGPRPFRDNCRKVKNEKIKETIARDFQPLVFFINRPYMEPRDKGIDTLDFIEI